MTGKPVEQNNLKANNCERENLAENWWPPHSTILGETGHEHLPATARPPWTESGSEYSTLAQDFSHPRPLRKFYRIYYKTSYLERSAGGGGER